MRSSRKLCRFLLSQLIQPLNHQLFVLFFDYLGEGAGQPLAAIHEFAQLLESKGLLFLLSLKLFRNFFQKTFVFEIDCIQLFVKERFKAVSLVFQGCVLLVQQQKLLLAGLMVNLRFLLMLPSHTFQVLLQPCLLASELL